MKQYIRLMRAKHYIKNFLVFAALFFSGQVFDLSKLTHNVLGFFAFCAISSAVYIINDLRDRGQDRLHPSKCDRPIASGAISVKSARTLTVALIVLTILINSFVFKPRSSVILFLYLAFNIGYSLGLKNIPILDVAILVSGFVFRVMYGAMITEIDISNWLYLTVLALSFYLALGKRRNEIKYCAQGETRPVLKFYNYAFLDKNMYMFLSLTVAFYALWSMDQETVVHYNNSYIIFSVPLVFLIVMRYSLDIEGDSEGDPVNVLIHDKVLILLCTVYTVFMLTILYLI